MKQASTWFKPGALRSSLFSAICPSRMEYCWTWGHAPSGTWGMWQRRTAWKLGRSTGGLLYSSCQKARTGAIKSWASVRSVCVLGTLTFHMPDGPEASTFFGAWGLPPGEHNTKAA